MTNNETRDLKYQINLQRITLSESLIPVTTVTLVPYTDEDRLQMKEGIARVKGEIQALLASYYTAKDNMNKSSFYEWHPHKGMNRQQAREFRRSRRKK